MELMTAAGRHAFRLICAVVWQLRPGADAFTSMQAQGRNISRETLCALYVAAGCPHHDETISDSATD